jgi:enoyl-CoA hydratase/carnithine racemase
MAGLLGLWKQVPQASTDLLSEVKLGIVLEGPGGKKMLPRRLEQSKCRG